jgi:aspartyl-tRNA(Asn)/glutamyl-tRNA(Gln) amidotransferase subunit B
LNPIEKYELVVGLEVHAQLLTESKLFCSDSALFGAEANTHVGPISIAHPGTLPKLNKKAIELAVRLGVALDCQIEKENFFARKNYFYPDLPKGYQISQHTAPICIGGSVSVELPEGEKKILLNRIHIEEDAGKSVHDMDEQYTYIDLNRSGVALVEIVTEPVIHSSDEAFLFLTNLRSILRWLDVCDGNMEEGSMRCDANISIRMKGDTQLGKRVEIKNLNSIRNVKRAIDFEFIRLVSLAEEQKEVVQETRSYDAERNFTFSLRNKEDADDYRYFPEPDLPPFQLTEAYISDVKNSLPELPEQLKKRYQATYQLNSNDISVICSEKSSIVLFEQLLAHSAPVKAAANWITGPIKQHCNEEHVGMNQLPIDSSTIAKLILLTESGKVSFSNASGKIFTHLLNFPDKTPEDAIFSLNLEQNSDETELLSWIEETIKAMPEKVKEYQSGKKGLIGLFAGEVKKKSKGKADMQLVTRLIAEKLSQN